MKEPIYSGIFKRDVKRAEKRGKDMSALRTVLRLLLAGEIIPATYKDHPLKGNWKHYRDLHIEPDWLLIYKTDDANVWLVRTGTHADIFGT
ncbi:MAG: type II toxin-antitoxin system YafQ family toxin [Gallionellaceae bacterium]|jgi:mRNA interferase YafQ|nr:type II toxin-antitoxin system YafQ family toxin [Gallionellaceae bacterium]